MASLGAAVELAPGLFIAGEPASPVVLESFEGAVGILPATLRELYLRHSYAWLKGGGILMSPNLQDERARGQRILRGDGEAYLAIVEDGAERRLALKQDHGQWVDSITAVMVSDPKPGPSGSESVDELLVDWPTTRWPWPGPAV